MNSIIEYRDYRQYILDYYLDRKSRLGFTWRDFAKCAGFASASYLKLVCDRKTRLTEVGAEKTATAMGLAGFEQKYFYLMIKYNDAKDQRQKKLAFEEMYALAAAHKVRIAGGDLFAYFDSWKNPVIRELAPAMPGASCSEMANQCYPKVTATEVAETIRFLKEKELLIQDNEGNLHRTDRSITTGPMDVVPEAVHSMQQQMAELATFALDSLPITERNFSGVTMGITKKTYARILEEMTEFRRKVVAIASEDDETDQVYRLNLQFFPLTKSLRQSQDESLESHSEDK